MLKARADQTLSRKRAVALKLSVVVRQMHKRFDQRVGNIGITRSQWTLVAVIARHPGATQREVAEILEMSEASAGRLIDRLCLEGMLERKQKEDDRRAYCIHLTDKGGKLLERISLVATENEDAAFVGFEPDDLDRFEAYLDILAANAAAPS